MREMTPAAKRIAALLEKRLRQFLTRGTPQFDADGLPLLDKSGKHVHRPPSAAILREARGFLTGPLAQVDQTLTPEERLHDAARKHGRPVSTPPDPASLAANLKLNRGAL